MAKKETLPKKNGRPQEYDRLQVMQDLLAWSLKDDSTNLNGFSGQYSVPPNIVISLSKESPEFLNAYSLVKSRIAHRRENKLNNGELHVKAYDINIRVYDEYNKAEHRGDLEFQSQLKTAESKEAAESLAPFADLMKSISDQQKP